MRLVVAGASGFIGRNFLLALPKQWKVVALYHRSSGFPRFVKEKKLLSVTPLRCDLTHSPSPEQQRRLAEKFDACVFFAANSDPSFSVKDPESDFRMTALTVLHFLSHVKTKRLLYVSSGAVYEGLRGRVSPKTRLISRLPYAISHLAAEQYVRSFATFRKNPEEYLIIRFFGAYGPYEPPRKIYTKLIQSFTKGKKHFTIRGNGKNWIDAMYITDATTAFLRALRSPLKNATFDLCSARPLPIERLVQRAAKLFKVDPVTIHKVGPTVEAIHFRASPSFQKNKLRFQPKVSLETGLRKFAAFLKEEGVS